MTDANPPPEAQRFGRSQTPESPRPVHIPEPSTIPVLRNQMDPVFNDTETYNIPHDQPISPFPARTMNDLNDDGQDAVQSFLRGAEQENASFENAATFPDTNGQTTQNDATVEATLLSALANASAYPQSSEPHASTSQETFNQAQPVAQPGYDPSSVDETKFNASDEASTAILPSGAERSNESDSVVKPTLQSNQGGVDYQSLLDTISQSASTAPAADPISAPTTATSLANQGAHSLPPVPGLPPKPPTLATSADSSSYYLSNPREQLQSDDFKSNGAEPFASGAPPSLMTAIPAQAPGTWNQLGGQPLSANTESTSPSHAVMPREASRSLDPTERPWTPTTQGLYDQFLEDERRYVTEGIWDKFPQGSRLFVGNLPSEKVTKRDLFHTFHRHGRLAQISIKQAYGFIQYLEASSCQAALQAEQGVEIRGRKIHLEISKPQKNTKNPGQGNKRRRSRSPDRGAQRQHDRRNRSNVNDYREDRDRRDAYGPVRSPSPPRGYRSRDRPSAQSPRFGSDTRPRSPYANNFPPPIPSGYDEEANLPLPRRDPREVPDVQILVLEPSVAQSFINWIEQGFRAKGLRASTIWLSARLPLNALVKRQIIEGVQAVVKLTQAAQYNSKIPLQLFDRSTGASNVNFNEYIDLDVPVAADIVLHARQKERGATQQSPQAFSPHGYPSGQYGHPPTPQYSAQMPPAFPPQQQHNQYPYNQNAHYQNAGPTPVTPNSATAAPNLQQLLANLRQPGDPQQNSAGGSDRPTPDLAGLLSNVTRQQQGQPFSPPGPPQQHHQGYGAAPAYGTGQQPQPNVQNIMETLARYNR